MLYDPKWDAPAEAVDSCGLDSFVAWLKRQPARRKYCYKDNEECLLAQYFAGYYGRLVFVLPHTYRFVGSDGHIAIPFVFDSIAADRPHTFGAALGRARAALAANGV